MDYSQYGLPQFSTTMSTFTDLYPSFSDGNGTHDSSWQWTKGFCHHQQLNIAVLTCKVAIYTTYSDIALR